MDYLVESVGIAHEPGYVQRLDPLLHERGLNIGRDLQKALASELQLRGYETGTAPDQSDALLQCTSFVAFYSGGMFGTSYTPEMQLDISLTNRSSQKIVFARRFFYTGSESPLGVTVIKADPGYSFDSDEALIADPERAADGLEAGAQLLARAVAEALAGARS